MTEGRETREFSTTEDMLATGLGEHQNGTLEKMLMTSNTEDWLNKSTISLLKNEAALYILTKKDLQYM